MLYGEIMDTTGLLFPKPKKKKHQRETVSDATYKAVYERDKGRCRLCGKSQYLQLHHINGRGKDLTNKIDNCIMLCGHCHLEVVHKENGKYRKILNEIIGG